MKPLFHPRLCSPFCWHPTDVYRCVLTAECSVDLKKGWVGQHEITLPNGLVVKLDGDLLTIPKGYASDLTSPAIYLFGHWIGTPSGEREALAALVHDVLRQLLALRLACLPKLTRRLTDDEYFDFLHEAKSIWCRLFHHVVASPLGSFYMRLTVRPESGHCRCHEDSNASQNQASYSP